MNTLQPFDFKGEQVRTLTDEHGNPWFVAKDVCDVLGITNNRDAIAQLDDDEKGVVTIDTLGGPQKTAIVGESGLYSLVLRSRKPEAREFKRWITREVLPSIRKTGAYSTESPDMALAKALMNPKAVAGILTELDRTQSENRQLTARNAELEPKAQALDDFTNTAAAMTIRDAASILCNMGLGEIKESRLRQWLVDHKWIYRKGRAYKAYHDRLASQHLIYSHAKNPGMRRDGSYFELEPTVYVTRKGLVLIHQRLSEEKLAERFHDSQQPQLNQTIGFQPSFTPTLGA